MIFFTVTFTFLLEALFFPDTVFLLEQQSNVRGIAKRIVVGHEKQCYL